MSGINRIIVLCVTVWVVFHLATCRDDPKKVRAQRARDSGGEVKIGVAWPFEDHPDKFRQGAELAIEEVNAAGGIMGRKLFAEFKDDGNTQKSAEAVAAGFVSDLDIVAVIGHYRSEVALPLSITYDHAGVLFISPGATDPNLTHHRFPMVFGSMPNDDEFGRNIHHIREFEGYQNVQRLVVLNSDDIDGRSFATAVQYHLARGDSGLKVVGQYSFRANETNFRRMLSGLSGKGFDAIVLACDEPPAGLLMRQAREMGIMQPFIGGTSLDSLDLWKSAGRAADGTMVASIYSMRDERPAAVHFRDAFKKRFGKVADPWAAQGYDAVKMLAAAMNQSATTVPSVVADALRLNIIWEGATGTLNFDDQDGHMEGANIVVKIMYDGQWTYPHHHILEASQ